MARMGIPQSPKIHAERPLVKGIVKNTPSQGAPEGSVQDAQNFMPHERGLKRRLTYTDAFQGDSVEVLDLPMQEVGLRWTSAGDKENLLITRKHLYKAEIDNGLTRITWTVPSSGTNTADSFTLNSSEARYELTDSSEDFEGTSGVVSGDVLVLSPGTADEESFKIIGFDNDSDVLYIQATPGPQNHSSGSTPDYRIHKTFNATGDYRVDFENVEGDMIFADHSSRTLLQYDGTDLQEWSSDFDPDGGTTLKPTRINCFSQFDDRLWIGGMTESGTRYPRRIRWSNVANFDAFPSSQYQDIVGPQTEVRRLVPLGNLLVAYFGDQVWIGRITNIVNQPVVFTLMPTGNVGLVGSRAVADWIDGHFFVGQNDIYYLSATNALQRIGTPVLQDTLEQTPRELRARIQVTVDPENDRVLFLFPRTAGRDDALWSFHLRTNAWTYETTNTSMITSASPVDTITIGDLSSLTVGGVGTTYGRIGNMAATMGAKTLYVADSRQIKQLSEAAGAVDVVMETKDYDFGSPDRDATVLRLGIKLNRVLQSGESLEFEVFTSADKGNTWKQTVRNLTISQGEDEGSVDFRQTGSLFRARLTSSSNIKSYIIEEYTLKYRARGLEYDY